MQGRVSLRIFQVLSCLEVEIVLGQHSQHFQLVVQRSDMCGRVQRLLLFAVYVDIVLFELLLSELYIAFGALVDELLLIELGSHVWEEEI